MKAADEFGPVFRLAHDYGTHHHYCGLLDPSLAGDCTCGFEEATDAAFAVDARLLAAIGCLRTIADTTWVSPEAIKRHARHFLESLHSIRPAPRERGAGGGDC